MIDRLITKAFLAAMVGFVTLAVAIWAVPIFLPWASA